MVYLVDEDDPEERSPEELNAHAIKMRDSFNDQRRIVAVVKGSHSFLRHARATLSETFEAVVLTGDAEVLDTLDVDVLDSSWSPGQVQVSLDEVMARDDPAAERGPIG